MIDTNENERAKEQARQQAFLKRVNDARNAPINTCPGSRHTQTIAEGLIKDGEYHMLTEEPGHCGESLLSTVASLYERRTECDKLKQILVGVPQDALDGGWTAKGLIDYAKSLEEKNAVLVAELEKANAAEPFAWMLCRTSKGVSTPIELTSRIERVREWYVDDFNFIIPLAPCSSAIPRAGLDPADISASPPTP